MRYIILTITIIILGLLSRKIAGIPLIIGDILWAMMIFFLISILFNRKKSKFIFSVSLIITYIIEFSQLYHSTWIDNIRRTSIGHLILGQDFLLTDLIAYLTGIFISYWLKELIDKRMDCYYNGK